ncbi:hypothetical protein AMECASPLE_013659 [Ameca splendens]|uniref:Uncharacterized protein n=1 Tax=Ameca splendens TaxID=208324 RepID=A0ABV0YZN6_9TELE
MLNKLQNKKSADCLSLDGKAVYRGFRKMNIVRSIKTDILKQKCQAGMFISMLSVLGWGSFGINYCIIAACHGDNQPVVLLRCNGNPGCFDIGLHLHCWIWCLSSSS